MGGSHGATDESPDLLGLDADTGHLLRTLRLPPITTPDDYDDFVKLGIRDIDP
ncbi:hypothetical protein [Streptomyces chartreusis]